MGSHDTNSFVRNEGDPPWRAALVSFVGASAGAGWGLGSAGGRAGAGLSTSARLMLFVDDRRDSTDRPMFALSFGATYPKLRQARADFIASDTATRITEPSRGGMGPDRERVVAERSPGINTLAGTIA